jgi:hypothetical protein
MLEELKRQDLSLSFETVTRCLSDHGQRPQGEYLLTTSIAHHCRDGRVEVLPKMKSRLCAIANAIPAGGFLSSVCACKYRCNCLVT